MLYFIPLVDALILGLVVYVLFRWLLKPETLRPWVAATIGSLEDKLQHKLEAADINMDVDSLLEERLDHLILLLKQQIPMASMLLSGPLAEKFKGQAKTEILKMLPSLKQRLLDRMAKEVDIKEWVLKQVQGIAIAKLTRRMAFYAALLGLIVGIINVIMMI